MSECAHGSGWGVSVTVIRAARLEVGADGSVRELARADEWDRLTIWCSECGERAGVDVTVPDEPGGPAWAVRAARLVLAARRT